MSDNKLSINEIIAHWEASCIGTQTNKSGHCYLGIPKTETERYDLFLQLIQTLLQEGYTKDDIKTSAISTKVVMTCWPERNRKITAKEERKYKDSTRRLWEMAVLKFTHIKMSNVVETKKPVPPPKKESPKLEETLEEILYPKDRIKPDATGFHDTPPDLEFLALLGIPPSRDE